MKKYIATALTLILIVVVAIGLVSSNSNKNEKLPTTTNGHYVALGDSVAAGIGLKDYSDSSACARTKQAYPNIVAQKLDYRLQSVACSGATTEKGLLGSQGVNKLAVAPQINAALSSAKPKLITATIGANDTDWTTYITKCYVAVCGLDEDTAAVSAGVATATANLETALNQIKIKYPTDTPKVAITGYYKLFPAVKVTNCTELTGINDSELNWIRQLQNSIDTSLQSAAAKYDFALYVPIDFSAHELCTESPWIQGLGSLAVYHPTAAGQKAMANQIVAAVKTNGDAQ